MTPTISVFLQLYKRLDYLSEQIDAILNQTIPATKLYIVQNEGGVSFDLSDIPEKIKKIPIQIVYAIPNMKFHLRFAVGLLADTEYVSFFDDDTIPMSNWHKNCLDTISKHDCLCGTNGRIVNPDMKSWTGSGWGTANEKEERVDLVGHAWFLKQKNLKYMWFDEIYQQENGEDIMLSANLQRFGDIPTFVPPHPKSDMSLWGSNPIKASKYGSDSVASWKIRQTHFEERFELIKLYVKKGWKLVLCDKSNIEE